MWTQFLSEEICYTGGQLCSHWILNKTGFYGDAVVAFVGSCDVGLERMVDLEDVRAMRPIFSQKMVHFVAEHFHVPLEVGVLRQRLMVVAIEQTVRELAPDLMLERKGDDLFSAEKKLSVSVAAPSSVSVLIHTGVNVIAQGTPVPTLGLADANIDPKKFATSVMERYVNELTGVAKALVKVRAV